MNRLLKMLMSFLNLNGMIDFAKLNRFLKPVRFVIMILSAFLFTFTASAKLKLSSIFTDNMVLQQGKPVNIWGWASPKQKITVVFLQKAYVTTADANGKWNLKLPAAKAGNAGELIVKTADKAITLKNVLIGEVWVCSGQSNMEFNLNSFKNFYAEEIKNSANDYIRFATVQNTFNNAEAEDVPLRINWTSVNPETVGKSSAVAYFFARKLQERLHIPVGFVISAWGGTPAQSWIDTNTVKLFSNYNDVYNQAIRKLDLAKLNELREEDNRQFRKDITEKSAEFKNYTAVTYNDEQWESVKLPGNWESNGHPDFDGIAAYRIVFNVAGTDAGKEATLHLPAIDDIDSTYINGIFLGSQKVWNELRTYKIPAGVLKEGKNCLAIWVEDDQGGGGLNNDTENFFVKTGTSRIELKGSAKVKFLLPLVSSLPGVNLSGIQNSPTVLFNAMIAPLLPLSIRGVIWYQGESNVPQYEEYRKLFPALINNWRSRWRQSKFPFLFVQLSSFNPSGKEPELSDWAFLREAQTYALKLSNTGMAVSTDVGDEKDIHPKQKREVGERLAANALKITYGFKNEIAEGPAMSKTAVEKNKIVIYYKSTGSGLMAKGDVIKGFVIAGADKIFHPAAAKLSGNTITVSSDRVPRPVYVRYAWANAPLDANLFNKEGFPAIPFRTDK